MAEDSDKDPAVVNYAEIVSPTFEEITLNSSLESGENLQDYMDDSLVESLNKTDTELNNETMSVTSSDTNHAVTTSEDDFLSSPQLPGKYNRSQSCASNTSNQSKAGFGEFCSVKDIFSLQHKISWGQVNNIPASPESVPVVARKVSL